MLPMYPRDGTPFENRNNKFVNSFYSTLKFLFCFYLSLKVRSFKTLQIDIASINFNPTFDFFKILLWFRFWLEESFMSNCSLDILPIYLSSFIIKGTKTSNPLLLCNKYYYWKKKYEKLSFTKSELPWIIFITRQKDCTPLGANLAGLLWLDLGLDSREGTL